MAKYPVRLKDLSEKDAGVNQVQPIETREKNLLDSVAEIVHQGYGQMLDSTQVREAFQGWKPNSSMNYEYVFAWHPLVDTSSVKINWKRPLVKVVRSAIEGSQRQQEILSGSPMSWDEQKAYSFELACRKLGIPSAAETLALGKDCQWVDLSFLTDSRGRDIYILEIGDALSKDEEDIDDIVEHLGEIWRWKRGGLTFAGPFASTEAAEAWMSENGAYNEVD